MVFGFKNLRKLASTVNSAPEFATLVQPVDANGNVISGGGGATEAWSPLSLLSANATGANTNNRAWTVPANRVYRISQIYASVVTANTGAARTISVLIERTGAVEIARIPAGVSQVLNVTRIYNFGVGLPDLGAFRGASSSVLMIPIPYFDLPTGHVIRVLDTANISTSDVITVHAEGWERTV